jgi:hypothetical protein
MSSDQGDEDSLERRRLHAPGCVSGDPRTAMFGGVL